MTMMISEIYDALTSAGAPEERARKAADAPAKNEDRIVKIESGATVIKWMMGFVLLFQVAIFAKMFLH